MLRWLNNPKRIGCSPSWLQPHTSYIRKTWIHHQFHFPPREEDHSSWHFETKFHYWADISTNTVNKQDSSRGRIFHFHPLPSIRGKWDPISISVLPFWRTLREDVRQNTKKNGLDKFYFIGKTPTIKDPAAGRIAKAKVPDQNLPLDLKRISQDR